MSLLIVNELRKHYGAQDVLRGAGFQIDPGEKLGLVGRNGGGKTTLLRIVEGLEPPDGGEVRLRKSARLGHVPQAPSFAPGVSVRAYVEQGLAEAHTTIAELGRVEHDMAEASGPALESLMKRHAELAAHLDVLGGYAIERNVDAVLSGIGLASELWEREARTLSGGEKSRTALARELLAGHDLLLLDEPTNHLDLEGIEWIEAWLHERKGAVLIVSHDRRLLDVAVDAILELEFGEVRRYPGNYSKYVALKEERYVTERRAWEQQQAFISKEEGFIRKHIGSQRTAEAKGRQKKLEHIVRLREPHDDVRRPRIAPPKAARGGELVLEARGLGARYGKAAWLFRGLDLRIGRGQRVGIVGHNGSGKSTLLKLLAGVADPAVSLEGTLDRGHKAVCGFYDQETRGLDEEATPLLELRREHPLDTDQTLRDHLARFLFRGNDVDKSVRALSGGERARLCLAKLTMTEPSWLAMDEPTNHLDLAARTALEEMLSRFDGALVFVSHDRAFLDALCTHVVAITDAGVRQFRGNYSEWRAHAQALAVATKPPPPAAKPKPAPRREPARGGGKIKNRYKFEQLEQRIMALEKEREELHAACVTESVYRDAARLKETQIRIAEIEDELATANAEWEAWIE